MVGVVFRNVNRSSNYTAQSSLFAADNNRPYIYAKTLCSRPCYFIVKVDGVSRIFFRNKTLNFSACVKALVIIINFKIHFIGIRSRSCRSESNRTICSQGIHVSGGVAGVFEIPCINSATDIVCIYT